MIVSYEFVVQSLESKIEMLPTDMKERLIKRTALRKPGEPEDVANAIVFLASDKAKYITGIVLNVSGGIELFTF